LSTVNAVSEARTIEATPSAEATVHTARPVETPNEVPSAARRPCSSAFLVTIAVSGPGTTITTAAIPTNSHRWWITR
jgi:hypothetical protein